MHDLIKKYMQINLNYINNFWIAWNVNKVLFRVK